MDSHCASVSELDEVLKIKAITTGIITLLLFGAILLLGQFFSLPELGQEYCNSYFE